MREHLDDDALVDLSLAGGAPGTPTGVEHEHLSGCPVCSARLAAFDRVVGAARPDAADGLLQPPPHLWARIALEAGVPADPRATPTPLQAVRPARGSSEVSAVEPRRARRRLPALLAAAAVAGLVVGGGATWLAVGSPARDDGQVVAEARLQPFEGATGSGRAEIDRAGDAQRLVVDAALPDAGGRYYEVWLIDPDDGRLVSLGVLPDDDAPQRLALPDGLDLAAYRTVDVSLESADGDPGHSGRSVLRGTLLPAA